MKCGKIHVVLFFTMNDHRVRNILEKDQYFCHHNRRPTFCEPFVTKLLVTQSTTRYQMKDMDKIFLLIPHKSIWDEWFGSYSLSKSSIFWK